MNHQRMPLWRTTKAWPLLSPDLQRVIVAKVSAFPGCLTNRLNDFLVGMPQQQCPVFHEKVDVLVTVDVPLAASTAALDVERHRFAAINSSCAVILPTVCGPVPRHRRSHRVAG